jgi:hypothetical protein
VHLLHDMDDPPSIKEQWDIISYCWCSHISKELFIGCDAN